MPSAAVDALVTEISSPSSIAVSRSTTCGSSSTSNTCGFASPDPGACANVPSPCSDLTKPRCSRKTTADRRVVRETPYYLAISCWLGSRSPSRTSPDSICRCRLSAIDTYRSLGLFVSVFETIRCASRAGWVSVNAQKLLTFYRARCGGLS